MYIKWSTAMKRFNSIKPNNSQESQLERLYRLWGFYETVAPVIQKPARGRDLRLHRVSKGRSISTGQTGGLYRIIKIQTQYELNWLHIHPDNDYLSCKVRAGHLHSNCLTHFFLYRHKINYLIGMGIMLHHPSGGMSANSLYFKVS